MKYKVRHTTTYSYESEASLCHNFAYLIPRNYAHQQLLDFDYKIAPETSFLVERRDFFDNTYLYFSIEKSHRQLVVEAVSEVETIAPEWVDYNPMNSPPWEEVVEWLRGGDALNDTRQFYLGSDYVPILKITQEYALQSFTPGRPIFDAMNDLNSRVNSDFTFTPGFTDISTPVEEFYQHKKGVCQDYAHFTLSCLRSIGLSAMYMSGYIETLPPPGQPKLVGSDASHAWVALFIPDLGWVEFDPTNNIVVNDQHIRVAVGRDFGDITPLKGIVYSIGKQVLKVSVDVRKVEELVGSE